MSLSPFRLRAGATALLVVAPLAFSSACATASVGVPASQAAPVGNGAAIGGSGTDVVAARGALSTTVTFLGTVMTSDGFTLYRYAKDKAKPPKSTCAGPCAAKWPPVLEGAKPTLVGVDSAMIGTVTRPDGGNQLTVNGWPAYRYIDDSLPGIVNGQGVGGDWAAITGDGAAMPDKPAPTRPPAAVAPPASPAY